MWALSAANLLLTMFLLCCVLIFICFKEFFGFSFDFFCYLLLIQEYIFDFFVYFLNLLFLVNVQCHSIMIRKIHDVISVFKNLSQEIKLVEEVKLVLCPTIWSVLENALYGDVNKVKRVKKDSPCKWK